MLVYVIDEVLIIIISIAIIFILLMLDKLFIEIINVSKNVYFNSYSI